jgi:TRAP-type C4-dicarboxylate transport system substrate-binding protein
MSILKVLKDFFVTESYYDSKGYFHSMPPETKEVVADTYTVSAPEVKEKVSTPKRVQRTKIKEKGATIKPPITTSTLEN